MSQASRKRSSSCLISTSTSTSTSNSDVKILSVNSSPKKGKVEHDHQLQLQRKGTKPDCSISSDSLRIVMLQLLDGASPSLAVMKIDVKQLIADYACTRSSNLVIHLIGNG